jgi:hypothetical protein
MNCACSFGESRPRGGCASRYARRGTLLVATVVGMTTLLLVVATMVLTGGREAELAQMRFQEARAGYAADAGANMALREIKHNTDIDGDGAIGTVSDDGKVTNDPAVGAAGAMVYVSPAGANTYTVASRMGVPLRTFTLTATPGAAAAHSDGFEGYTTGAAITGAGGGGWGPWDANPGAVAYASNTYSRTGVKSQDVQPTSDSVHLYTQTSGQWLYSAWQYIPSAATGAGTYFILLNTYADGGGKSWSTQVYFDLASNSVYDNMSGGVTGSARTIVRDQWVQITVAIDLDLGVQTVSYNGQELFTGSWNRQGGNRWLQAVDLFGSSADHVYYDDISLTSTGAGSGASVTMVEAP